jgi:Tol biopolymer transport system component
LGTGAYSVSAVNTLAYAGALRTPSRLTWFDRRGNPAGTVGVVGDYTDFRLAPDGTRLAASLVDPKTGFPDIWLTDLARGNPSPFTFGPALNAGALWSPEGTKIIFRTTRSGGLGEFYTKSAGGGGTEEPVVTLPQLLRVLGTTNMSLSDWSPDGSFLLFPAVGSSDWDLWVVSLTRPADPAIFLSAPGDQWHGNFSPDGKLVAYTSSESGRFEVKVQTFPLSDRQWTVSTDGGYEPRWKAEGGEIYYLSADQKLMAVAVRSGPVLRTSRATISDWRRSGRPSATHSVRAEPQWAAISHQHAGRRAGSHADHRGAERFRGIQVVGLEGEASVPLRRGSQQVCG